MKTIILGDTHGRDLWKKVINLADRIVFIGDYFDTHEDVTAEQQCNNFLDIMAYYRANPGKVILLIGNHDYHYMDIVPDRYSGYQSGAAPQIKYLLEKYKDCLQMCYEEEGFVCTHAGISEVWLEMLEK